MRKFNLKNYIINNSKFDSLNVRSCQRDKRAGLEELGGSQGVHQSICNFVYYLT